MGSSTPPRPTLAARAAAPSGGGDAPERAGARSVADVPRARVAAPAAPCRSCGADRVVAVLDLGRSAVPDRLVAADRLAEPDPTFDLRLGFCPDCMLLQLLDVPDGAFLYDEDYPYYTTALPGLLAHFRASAHEIMARLPLGAHSLVVEAASNDGYMLREFAARGIPVLGIDPAPGPARLAEEAGVPTLVDFFCTRVAHGLAAEGRQADLILGNNVLNLVPHPEDFARAVDVLLAPDGEVVLEIPYAVETVRNGWYDNLFLQNSSYFSLLALDRLFRRHGLRPTLVERLPLLGTSLRVRLARTGPVDPSVDALLEEERALGVDRADWYGAFGDAARAHRDALRTLLLSERARGHRIVAYGAAGGMATTLLAGLGLPDDVLEYAVDVNPYKHGKFTPGLRLPIHPPSRLAEDRPDLVLLLAWNYAQEILAGNEPFRRAGGRFIIPFPEPRVV